MNCKITMFLKERIAESGVKYRYISIKTGISYQRLMRIFNQNAIISGSELIALCRLLNVKQSDLMLLVEDVA